jgi:hypothetical protein
VVTRDSARRRGVDLSERVTHGVLSESGHVVVVQIECGDAGAGDQQRAQVNTARVVHARVGGSESSEVRQRRCDSGQKPRRCFFNVAVGYVESSQ